MKFILLLVLIITLISVVHSTKLKFGGSRYRSIRKKWLKNDDYRDDKWLIQLLDHFNPMESRTWRQRYFLSNEYYKEGGPIFLMVSGEQQADPAWLDENASLEGYLAKKFGARIIFLEHRYYGMSRPTDDLSEKNLSFLSVDQALADTAYFIKEMRELYNLPPTTKWILFGASYAGSLVAWMRYKYPHLVYGAVSNSAPLLAQVDFQDFFSVVEETLRKHSTGCVDKMTIAFNEVYVMLRDNKNHRKLEELFKVCGNHFEMNTQTYDVINFYEGIIDIATDLVFNNDSYNLTVEKACDIIEDESNGRPLDRLAMINDLLLQEVKKNCLNLEKYNDTIYDLKNIAWDAEGEYERPWIYQTCTEFGWYQTTTARPFNIPSDAIPMSMYKQLCSDVFGESYKQLLDVGVERTNLMFGGLDIANATSNVVFVHGSNDPWHAAGVITSQNPKITVLYVEGGGHCPLINPPRTYDSPSKAEAKRHLQEIIENWLQEE